MSARHELRPTPEALHWGYFDAALAPVLTIESGDVVTVGSVSGAHEDLPPEGSGLTVRPEHAAALAGVARGMGPHILTGPIAVTGAEPGDALRVEILAVDLADDWGFNLIKPLLGALPDDFHETSRVHLPIDRGRRMVRMPWGLEAPARPFFGVIGTAPPRAWGRLTSVVPRAFGGNVDNKELTAGAVLLLPVFESGGLLSVGDGHAAQGDGEVCLTAVETGLVGTLRLTLVKGARLAAPRAETADHLITMGFHESLDEAMRAALRDMIRLLGECTGLGPEDAYRLCSIAADLRVTQVVNQHKGVHAMLPRWALGRS